MSDVLGKDETPFPEVKSEHHAIAKQKLNMPTKSLELIVPQATSSQKVSVQKSIRKTFVKTQATVGKVIRKKLVEGSIQYFNEG